MVICAPGMNRSPALRITFELNDDDLKHFRLIMKEARKVAARIPPEEIIAAAEEDGPGQLRFTHLIRFNDDDPVQI